ncbi:Protein jagged-1a, partial [Stegodyphus mimosarum]
MEGSEWEFECNTCICQEGKVICSRVSCEKKACEYRVNFEDYSKQCPRGELCVPQFSHPCLSAPCEVSRFCQSHTNTHLYLNDHMPTHCKPNYATPGNNCAKLSLVFSDNILFLLHSTDVICLEL